MPPSPSAAAITKYVDFPVNYYSGTPQISIPIHTLSGKGISVPVSLSYHAGGTKVDEVASHVGLGWSLNAGGVINRTVRGFQDEELDGYLNRGANVPYPIDLATNFDDLKNFADGYWDGQPDLFNFSFGGYSGKFIFREDGSVMQIPFQDLDIDYDICSSCPSPLNTAILSFTITTPDGIRYTFGTASAVEYSTTASTGQSATCRIKDFSNPAVTAWYLKEIQHPTTLDNIVFHYSPHTIQYDLAYSESFSYPTTPQTGDCSSTYSHTSSGCISIKTDHGVNLDSIVAINGKVTFISDGARSDLVTQSGSSRLKEIQIKGKQNGTLKIYKLVQSFIQSTGATPSTEASSKYRMYLDEIETYTATNVFSNEYKFEYNNRSQLPPRLSFKQDHWGYFNNENNLQMTPAPDGAASTLNYIQSYFTSFSAANRAPDGEKAQYGNIKKITYPTGGFVEYEFEGNELAVCRELQQKKDTIVNNYITYTTGPATTTNTFTLEYPQLITVVYDIFKMGFRANGASVHIYDINDLNDPIETW
ncbi:hypothetical protein [Flavilitoribacter nigricans]|nr:hypothetical protein [Flavilitoribacter nigricans]